MPSFIFRNPKMYPEEEAVYNEIMDAMMSCERCHRPLDVPQAPAPLWTIDGAKFAELDEFAGYRGLHVHMLNR